MTDMPELIYLYDRGVPRGMQVVYGGTRIVGDTEYTRSDTIQALRESHDRLLEALKLVIQTHDFSCKGEECQISGIDVSKYAIDLAEKLQEGR